jgi:DNA-binding transcriptional MerR regulator
MNTLWLPLGTRRYTKQDLIREARAAQYHITGRMLDDWVEKGLLDQPNKQGLARGGSFAWWSQHQRDLLLTLLDQHRRKGVRSISVLCNIPVHVWLYWGEDWGVPLRQVKRALSTWSEGNRVAHSYPAARRAAATLVRATASRHARGGRRKEKAITRLTELQLSEQYLQRDDVAEEIYEILDDVIDPYRLGEAKGPKQTPLAAGVVSGPIRARILALKYLGEIPDGLWDWARAVLLLGIVDYGQKQSELASNAEAGHLFEPLEMSKAINNACSDLLTVLGMSQLTIRLGWPASSFGPGLQPALWLAGGMMARVKGYQTLSPVLLPSGGRYSRIGFTITISPKITDHGG